MTAVSSDGGAMQTYAPACIDMISLFTSCTSKIDGFTTLAFRDQASCYCCQTSRRRVVWTDELDSYASTCADWAVTGEPETAYSVAKTFETFCERFTDVCDTSRTVSEISTTTDESVSAATDSSSSNRGGIITITHVIVEMTGPSSPKPELPSAKGGLSTGAIAGIAVGVGIVALLALCGVFFWCWKTKRSSKPQTAVPQIQPTQQEQPVVYIPHGQQSPVYGSPPPFSPVYQSNPGYQTSSLPAPPRQTQFVAELSARK
ncbi:hypothetical protein FAVG1_12139 [Fusarium avenaceum]|nr:hypothetical protein FAVG1_12139 [Fusarium avenaceum]